VAKTPKIKFDVTASDPDKAISRQTFESPRPGRYVAIIQDANFKEGKNDDGEPDSDYPMIEVVYEITDADKKKNKQYAGARLWSYVLLPGHPSYSQTVWKLDQLLQAAGIAGKKKRKGSFAIEELVGLEVEIIVRAGTGQDKKTYRGEVGQVLAYDEDTFGGDDEDEDDDEDTEDLDEDLEDDDEDEDEDTDDEEDEDEDADEDEDEDDEEEDLESMSLRDLKAMAREAGIRVGKGMSKEDIIEALESTDEEDEDEDEEEEEEEPAPKPRKKSSAKKPAAKKQSTKKTSSKKSSGKKGKDGFPFK
jgi:Rho termination factor, N-terminal domain